MTTKPSPGRLARKDSLTRRLDQANADLKATNGARQSTPFASWLRTMAGHRREIAAIYRQASKEHGPETIEWNACMDAAISLECQAAANLTHAEAYDPAGGPTGSAQATRRRPSLVDSEAR